MRQNLSKSDLVYKVMKTFGNVKIVDKGQGFGESLAEASEAAGSPPEARRKARGRFYASSAPITGRKKPLCFAIREFIQN